MTLDKSDAIVAFSVTFLAGMLFAIWITWDMPAGSGSPRKEPINYQLKYGEEVCRQRNADLHRLGGLNYLVCMDKTTKVLSDFD